MTAAGTQRWRCLSCGASSVRKRPDVTRRGQLHEFLSWLMGKDSQGQATNTLTGRSMRRNTAWCWDVEPTLTRSPQIHHEVLVDGIWVGTWCLLIAVTKDLKVLAWQWCARESTAAWTALLEQVAAPAVIVCRWGFRDRGSCSGLLARDENATLHVPYSNECQATPDIAATHRRGPNPAGAISSLVGSQRR